MAGAGVTISGNNFAAILLKTQNFVGSAWHSAIHNRGIHLILHCPVFD